LPFCHFSIKTEKPKHPNYPMEIKTLGDRIRARRMDLGLYQKDVAARIGVSEDTICYWENQRVMPSPESLTKLSRFLEST